MPINSKQKGSTYERQIAQKCREHGFTECITSRLGSKALDDAKVDLMHTDPFNIQCKAVERGLNPFTTLSEMPLDTNFNVVFWKKNRKGTIVCMEESDFWEIVDLMKHNGVI